MGYISRNSRSIIADGITIDLAKGNFVALLGKNGIGKSTLLRTLSKVQPKLKGAIYINGMILEQVSIKDLSQQVSVVLTERIPESNLTVYELIAMGRQPYTNWIGTLTDKDQEHITAAITSTKIEELVHKQCDQLSDGQLQKVMIARALAQNTDIIILDEPTAHLDIHHKIEVFKVLKKLVDKMKKTVIISTHEIQLALQLADELWLMNEGEFISGPTDHLITTDKLSSLFDSQFVKFDAKSKQFIIKT